MTDAEARTHRRGFLLSLFGVLVLTPDTLVMRLIDIDPWTMSFWRGAMMAVSLYVAYSLVRRGKTLSDTMKLGAAGLAVAVIYALNKISFVFALE